MSNAPRNATKYRQWWEANAPVPYGFCWCKCNEQTTIPTKTNRRLGRIKGEPMRYLSGHSHRKGRTASPSEYSRQWRDDQPNVPFGHCCCG